MSVKLFPRTHLITPDGGISLRPGEERKRERGTDKYGVGEFRMGVVYDFGLFGPGLCGLLGSSEKGIPLLVKAPLSFSHTRNHGMALDLNVSQAWETFEISPRVTF